MHVNNVTKIIFMCTPADKKKWIDVSRIVGKGIHSLNHIAKLKPEIEKLCQQHQFKYYVEENEGRILVKFGQGAGQLSQGEAASFWDNRQNYGPQLGYQQGYPGPSQQQQPHQQPQPSYQQPYQQPYQGQQQYQSQQNQGGQNNNDMVEQVVKKAAPFIFRKLSQCCTIM